MRNQSKTVGFCASIALIAMGAFPSVSNSAITPYFSDFNSATDLSPWEFFSDNAGLGAYNGAAPAAGPQISALANDGFGNQFINFFANYDNVAVHAGIPGPERISLFINQSFSGAEAAAGTTWYFNFDYASNPATASVAAPTEVGAFIRVFDGSFNLLAEQTFNTLAATPAFQSAELQQILNPVWTNGGFIQFGFNNAVDNFDPSGRFYDNVRWDPTVIPVPAAVWLFGSALGMLAWLRRKAG